MFYVKGTGLANASCVKNFVLIFGWLAAPVMSWGMHVCGNVDKLKQVVEQHLSKVNLAASIDATATGGNWYTFLNFVRLADSQVASGTDQESGAWKLNVGNKTACDATFLSTNLVTANVAFGAATFPANLKLGVSNKAMLIGNMLYSGISAISKTPSATNTNVAAFRMYTAWNGGTDFATEALRKTLLGRLQNCCLNNNLYTDFERCVRIASSTSVENKNLTATGNDEIFDSTSPAAGSFYWGFPTTHSTTAGKDCTKNIRPYLGAIAPSKIRNLELWCSAASGTAAWWVRTELLAQLHPATASATSEALFVAIEKIKDFTTEYTTHFDRPSAAKCNALFPVTVKDGVVTGTTTNKGASFSNHLATSTTAMDATTVTNFAALSAKTADAPKANKYAYGCCVMNDSNANMVKCLNWAFQTNLASKSVTLWHQAETAYTKSGCDTLMRTLPGVTNATELNTWVGHCTNATTRGLLKQVTEKTSWPTGANKWFGTSGLESLHNAAIPKTTPKTPAPAPKNPAPAPAPKTPTPAAGASTTFTPAAGNFKCEIKGLGCEQVSTADATKKIALKASTVNTCKFGAILKALGVTLLTTLIMNLLN